MTVPSPQVPWILYGTAWKEDRTEELTLLALKSGFRGIDTANQRKHYFEEGVGKALKRWFADHQGKRADLFLQTKFTFQGGQDHRLPYDPRARITQQVFQSFDSSLQHLGVATLDSLVLHGPSQRSGWTAKDSEAYQAMEELRSRGLVRYLGVSNVDDEQLEALLGIAQKPPDFVQNRCYAVMGWDRDVRQICGRHGIVYQGFSLLTANQAFLRKGDFLEMAQKRQVSLAQLVFRFARCVGILPLTGTTQETHMLQDLATPEMTFTEKELQLWGA